MQQPKALIIGDTGELFPDWEVCRKCEHSDNGRMPDPVPLPDGASEDKGAPEDLCPPCVKSQVYKLGHWQGHGGINYPEEYLQHRLFKCRKWYWLIVPGLLEASPRTIQLESNN